MAYHTRIGSLVGAGLGVFFAFRHRANQAVMYRLLRAADQPIHLRFVNAERKRRDDL